MGKENNDLQLLAQDILNGFISRITGSNNDKVVGDIPDNVYFVGKLLSVEDEDSHRGSSRTFIDSIGMDFFISEEQVNDAMLEIYPQGDFYYRIVPTLKEQRTYFLSEFSKSNPDTAIDSFDQLMELYQHNADIFSDAKVKLVPAYKKVSLEKDDFYLNFSISDLLLNSSDYGYFDADSIVNRNFQDYIDGFQTVINQDAEWMSSAINERTTIMDLIDESSYYHFLTINSKRKIVSQSQNWKLYFDVSATKRNNKYLISIALVNNSTVFQSKSHLSKKKDKLSIETLFNSGFKVILKKANYEPIELDSFVDDYKYEKKQYAIGNNCSISFNSIDNSVATVHLPIYRQYRLVTNDEMLVKFDDLIQDPIVALMDIYTKMLRELSVWKGYKANKEPQLTEAGKEQIIKEISGFEDEIKRFKFGIDTINNYQIVKKSFIQMNKAFKATSIKYDTWRLFQIVFIVTMVPDIVACDSNVMQDENERAKTTLPYMSLLYFPTGGGKTEAFLGVLIFNMFFDRHRGKDMGVTSILRYPLRLLSVQQVQRLANIIAQAELIRRQDGEISRSFPFSLGYFVGDNNTPNKMTPEEYDRYDSMGQKQRDENRIIDVCPFCHKHTIHIRADRELKRLVHYCDNPECKSGGDLELYIVDTELYRYLPSAIISTIDKMSIMGGNANFRNVLNGASKRCPEHGFTSKNKCIEQGCDVEVQYFKDVDMYDPAPTLFIQDELHLIRESLGTYAAHYESLLRYYVKNVSKSKREIKVIGATATISSYQEQVYHLYMREPIKFPCTSIYLDHDFYSHIDETDLQRTIVGFAPFGKAIVNSVSFSIQYMREVVNEYLVNPDKVLAIPGIYATTKEEALELLKDYWIFLEYNNVKRDGNNLEGVLDSTINADLLRKMVPIFKIRKMTGDETFQDVREVLADIENNEDVYNGINLIIATSMISHGVDADRFNIMFFFGIPGNMAEYIQAYSRTGRKHPSVVIDVIRPSRETDMSFLRNFESMHKYKDLLVEPVPINRWASKAIDNTIPGIFTGILLMKYDLTLQYEIGSLFFMNNIKKAIQLGKIKKEDLIEEISMIYGCKDEQGSINDLGNQYRESIKEFINKVFIDIPDKGWDDENIYKGFGMLGYKIMSSLRDTDAGLIIELE